MLVFSVYSKTLNLPQSTHVSIFHGTWELKLRNLFFLKTICTIIFYVAIIELHNISFLRMWNIILYSFCVKIVAQVSASPFGLVKISNRFRWSIGCRLIDFPLPRGKKLWIKTLWKIYLFVIYYEFIKPLSASRAEEFAAKVWEHIPCSCFRGTSSLADFRSLISLSVKESRGIYIGWNSSRTSLSNVALLSFQVWWSIYLVPCASKQWFNFGKILQTKVMKPPWAPNPSTLTKVTVTYN